MIGTDIVIAARSLMQHTKRTVLLGVAISMVTALLVLLGGLASGVRSTMLESATTLITGHVNIGGFYRLASGAAAPLVVSAEEPLAVAKMMPEVEYATLRGRGYAKAVSATNSMDLVLSGVDITREPGIKRVVKLENGNLEALAAPNTMLLFADQAKRLRVSVGDDVTLSAPTGSGVNNTVDVRVVAVAKSLGLLSSFTAFISNATMRALYQYKPQSVGAIHLYLKDPEQSVAVAAALRVRLEQAKFQVMEPDPAPYWQKLMDKIRSQQWTGQRLDVTTWEDEMSFMSWILGSFAALSGLLMVILMVIIVIGIMNTMWIAIRERTREIGTMRAIGMQRRRVLWQFLLEALMLGFFGSVVGALLGSLIAIGLTALRLRVPESVQMFLMSQSLALEINFGDVVGRVLVVALATMLAALLPAVRAARLKPITAIHHIG